MSEYAEALEFLNRDLEQVIRNRDDLLEIATLPTFDAWKAFERHLSAEQKLKMDALIAVQDSHSFKLIQGYLQALSAFVGVVDTAEEQAGLLTERIVDLTKQKDEMFAQEE